MPKFSQQSLDKLKTCHTDLRLLFERVIHSWDCVVLEGERSGEQQQRNVAKGVSKTMNSLHLLRPSQAIDVAPHPLKWPKPPEDESAAELKRWMKEYALFYYFAGYVLACADSIGLKIRHGGDWDMDRNILEQDFDDLVHFELVDGE
jgi:peptidoglycan LD-endopeptidase CwlK